MQSICITFLVAVLCTATYAQQPADRVPVAVYYESLCPDSIKFFNTQLYPTLQTDLGKYVNLTLNPYGKSKQSYENGEHQFTCHHGPDECDGNKVQVCAISKIDGGQKTLNLGYNKIVVNFIDCLMKEVKRTPYSLPAESCATRNNVPNFAAIQECRTAKEGSDLLSNSGHLTDQLQNPLKSVPTVVFNKQYNEADSKLAQDNFAKALCAKIANSKDIKQCQNTSGAGTHSISTVVALVVAAVFFYQF